MSRIVVGVDGSEESAQALAWAIEEGRLREVPIDVVYAYDFTPEWQKYAGSGALEGLAFDTAGQTRSEEAQAREHGEALVHEMIDAVVGADQDGLLITRVVVDHSRPAHYLVEHASNALMLVVGSRGRGALTGLVLGSVSQYCALHARCPLVIVRG
jgi:nucleotide-binding universal stress UspA family protein